MAITRRFQAQVVVDHHQHSQLVTMHEALLKQQVEILEHKPNPDGTVTLVLCGQGLGKWAVPVPPHADIAIVDGKAVITKK